MPLYDYVCKRCNKTFEMLVTGSGTPICPDCGSHKMNKLLSLPAQPGKSKRIIASARTQAAREGHFSHYSASEKPRRQR